MENRTITALFDEADDAAEAIDKLHNLGIDQADIRLIGGPEPEKGFWESLGDMFFPDEDREVYSEGLRRGNHMVTVTNLTDEQFNMVADVLDDEGTIDVDQREASWREGGWTGGAKPTPVSPGTRLNEEGETVIPIVEETVKIGKRDTTHGRTRIKSYVVEKPVEEEVTLRKETVSVERNPVDRPATEAEIAGQETVVETTEHHEEPIVQTEARVVEEVVVKKDVETTTETVKGTTRKTEVEVEGDDDLHGGHGSMQRPKE